MDLLVAQRDHGIVLGRTAGGDITSQSSQAHQNNRHTVPKVRGSLDPIP